MYSNYRIIACPVCGKTTTCADVACENCDMPHDEVDECIGTWGQAQCKCTPFTLMQHIIMQRTEIEWYCWCDKLKRKAFEDA